jgi:uncharacterized iron-regulated membrane protein
MTTTTLVAHPEALASTRLYRAVWRWHFYAGLFIIPFLLVLACTGLIMIYGNSIETSLGARHYVAPGGERASYEEQAQAAVSAVPSGALKLMVVPKEDDRATVFIITGNGNDHVVAVAPQGPKVLGTIVKDDTWFYWASNIHGTLLLGDLGDRLLEMAAGLGIVLVLTGLYMWWPRNGRSLRRVLLPNFLTRGRGFWRELHVSLGFYISIVLLFFLLSGLSWTGIWGTQIVQAWNTFPAGKFNNVPLSDKTHASMNHGTLKEVPWVLEQTLLPLSGSEAGKPGLTKRMPVNLDTVAAFARANEFTEQFRINAPRDADGVYTISADSIDGDTRNPFGDRTVHIDRFSGKVLADIRFAEYGLAGKAMATGIALHQANLGWWNTTLNLLFCLSVITMALSGIVMWWKRRPAGRLGAPLYPHNHRTPLVIAVIALSVSVIFPLTGIAIIAFAIIDFLLPRGLKEIDRREATG